MTEALKAEAQRITLTPPVSERDHAQGLATAAITLVEYGDYHDPQCAAAQRWIKALQARMGDRLLLVFRHFPASSLFPHAAEAAEAAGRQGCFWGMYDTLFEHQSALGNGHLVEYARDTASASLAPGKGPWLPCRPFLTRTASRSAGGLMTALPRLWTAPMSKDK